MTPAQTRIYQWLRAGNTGTAAEISKTLGISRSRVHFVLQALGEHVTVTGEQELRNGSAPIYAWAGLPLESEHAQEVQEYLGGPIVVQALRERTPLERAWA